MLNKRILIIFLTTLIFLALLFPASAGLGQLELPTISAENSVSSGLVAEWKFDEGSGTTAVDSSGNGNTGTLLNGPTWVLGKVGNALSFDGVDDSVSVPTVSGSLNNMGAMTLSLWAYPKSLPLDYSVLLRKKPLTSPNARYVLKLDNAGKLIFNARYTLARGSWTTVAPLSVNAWHHIAVVYPLGDTAGNPTIYVDGISQGVTRTEAPSGVPVGDDKSLNIGSNNFAGKVFNGSIDQVRIYNRMLSASEVIALYQEGKAPTISISVLVPTSGSVGALITVSGSGFTPTDNTVRFGGGFVSGLSSLNGTSLSFILPSTLTVCPGGVGMGVPCLLSGLQVTPGQYQVSVQNANGASNAIPFMVTSNTTPPSRPNIVVIMSDDQDDTDSMKIMEKVKSLIADQGLTFKNSFVSDPQCCPSRAGFMSGQYAHNNGVHSNVPPDGGYEAFQPTQNNSLPVWLQQAGYDTALMGKYLNGYEPRNAQGEVPPGWNSWFGLVVPYNYYNFSINENGTIHTYGNLPTDYQTDVLSRKAADYITSHAGSSQPFFLWLTPVAPHVGIPGDMMFPEPAPRHKGLFANLPVPKSPSFNEADVSDKPSFVRLRPLLDASGIDYTEKSYRVRRETILGVDDMVGTVIDALKNSGKLENTLVIFTSDNGFFHGEHRKAAGKRDVYEESIRVPLVMRGPGVPHGQARNQLVSNIDLTATIMDLAQAIPERVLDGHSLTSLFTDANAPWRTSLLLEATEPWTFNPDTSGSYAAARTNSYVYAEHAPDANPTTIEKELYDLAVDPYELVSQHQNTKYNTVVNALVNTLHAFAKCQGSGCWITSQEPRVVEGMISPFNTSSLGTSTGLNVSGTPTWQSLALHDSDVSESNFSVPVASAPDTSLPSSTHTISSASISSLLSRLVVAIRNFFGQ